MKKFVFIAAVLGFTNVFVAMTQQKNSPIPLHNNGIETFTVYEADGSNYCYNGGRGATSCSISGGIDIKGGELVQHAMFHVKLAIMLVVVFVVLVKNIKVYEENSNIVLGIIVFSVLLPKRTEKCYPKDRSRLITYRYSENICIKNDKFRNCG